MKILLQVDSFSTEGWDEKLEIVQQLFQIHFYERIPRADWTPKFVGIKGFDGSEQAELEVQSRRNEIFHEKAAKFAKSANWLPVFEGVAVDEKGSLKLV